MRRRAGTGHNAARKPPRKGAKPRRAPRAEHIALKIDVAPELPQGCGDERRLTQVLLNLVGNAIKFTDVGEVSIKGSSANGSFNVAVM